MATWAVGDIHGKFTELLELEKKAGWNPSVDQVILIGDLVGRGENSIDVLHWAQQREGWVSVVLGNHDIALLAAEAGIYQTTDEFLNEALNHPKIQSLCDWLRRQHLIQEVKDYLLVHAGILPAWTLERLRQHALAAQAVLAGDNFREDFQSCWGNEQVEDDLVTPPAAQVQLAINVLTRMRLCVNQTTIDLNFAGKPGNPPAGRQAWFEIINFELPIICGHWSGLGLYLTDQIMMIDNGCVYGNPLCAFELESKTLITSK